jgi:hypothetical protein
LKDAQYSFRKAETDKDAGIKEIGLRAGKLETKAEKIINEPAPPKAILDEIKTAPVNTFAELEAFVPESEATKVYLALIKPVLSAMKEKIRLGIEVTEEDQKGLIYSEVDLANEIEALLAKEKEIVERGKIAWAQTYDETSPAGLGKTAVDLEDIYLLRKLAPAQAADPADYEAKGLVMEWWREDAKRLAADPNYRHYYSKAEIGSKDYFDYQLAKAKERIEADKKARALVLQGYNADKKEAAAAQTAPEAFAPFGGEELSSAECFAPPNKPAKEVVVQQGEVAAAVEPCKTTVRIMVALKVAKDSITRVYTSTKKTFCRQINDPIKDEKKLGDMTAGKMDGVGNGSNVKACDKVPGLWLDRADKITFERANVSMTAGMGALNGSLPATEPFIARKNESVSNADLREWVCGTDKISEDKIEGSAVRQTQTAIAPGGLEAQMMERKNRFEAFMAPGQIRKYEAKKAEMIEKYEELARIEAEIQESYRGSLSKTFKRASKPGDYERLKSKRDNLQAELGKAGAELIRMNLYAHLDPELDRSRKKVEAFRGKMHWLDEMTQKWREYLRTA